MKKYTLKYWQDIARKEESKYSAEISKMDGREKMYLGDKSIRPLAEGDEARKTEFVYNIVAENIESEVDSNIPQPKVTAIRQEDVALAQKIENWLRNEIDRLPFESINDMAERTCPIQGGTYYLVEWDESVKTHSTNGEIVLSTAHPKMVIPQNGVFTGVEDMDYIILKLPQTKEYIKRRYGVDVDDEAESDPEVKNLDGGRSDSMVTQYVVYYRNSKGGIGKFSWVNDTEIENMEDYQARMLRRCAKCGALETLGEYMPKEEQKYDSTADEAMLQQLASGFGTDNGYISSTPMEGEVKPVKRESKKASCPYCGSTKFEESIEEYEELYLPRPVVNGVVVPGARNAVDEFGVAYLEPTRVPFYKPNVYPLILQKNVSLFGRLLGDSDVDKIEDQQNAMNRIGKKINDRILKAGTRITLPSDASIKMDGRDSEVIYLNSPADKSLIGAYDFKGDLEYEMYWFNALYQQARQELGITNAFQGRDDTATSGKAKQAMAAQSAGRLESKRILKYEAYSKIYETMFKFFLAFADEPRQIKKMNERGDAEYETIDRYEFLLQDKAGEYYWNDRFLFSCDVSSGLASNRQQMWQELTNQLTAGAFGNPGEIDTLILYWTKMEEEHYPGAGKTKKYLEQKKQEQAMLQRQMAQQQMMGGGMPLVQ